MLQASKQVVLVRPPWLDLQSAVAFVLHASITNHFLPCPEMRLSILFPLERNLIYGIVCRFQNSRVSLFPVSVEIEIDIYTGGCERDDSSSSIDRPPTLASTNPGTHDR